MITKKNFREWITGLLLPSNMTDLTITEMEEAKQKAVDIVEFAEEHNLLNPDLKEA